MPSGAGRVNAQPRPTGRRVPELLAPAGGPEAGYAALQYGADAVYAGLARFSARAEAVNFSESEFEALTAYAHALPRRRRVYLTLNTLVLDGELGALADTLLFAAAIGVDALILQDLGVAALARRHAPDLRLHASTQTAVHNRAGVELARDLGFARATLARELTLAEVAELASAPGIETEHFVHGALCYSYSGLCLLSSHVSGRSGNRGRCAYLCRLPFRAAGREGFFCSMKDLALSGCLDALCRTGVAALKIEGRMKSPLYVAAAVRYYRRLLDGAGPDEARHLAADLQTIFSRPWTELYARARRARAVVEPSMVGHRGHPAGRVTTVVRPRDGRPGRLRLMADRPIEAHDGLQIEAPGAPRPYGFAVERMRILEGGPAGAAFAAPAGALIEVQLPADAPPIPRGAVVFLASAQDLKRRYRVACPPPGRFRVRVPARFELRVNEAGLEAAAEAPCPAADGGSVSAAVRVDGPFAAARSRENLRAAVDQAFAKLGATRFEAAALVLHDTNRRFLPASQLNPVRRRLTDSLEAAWQQAVRARAEAIRASLAARPALLPAGPSATGPATWTLLTDCPAALGRLETPDWDGVEEVVVALPPGTSGAALMEDPGWRSLAERLGRDRLRLALPTILRGWEMASCAAAAAALVAAGWRRWQVSNWGAWRLLHGLAGAAALDVAADWPLYVMNRAAADALLARGFSRVTCSPEDSLDNLRRLLPAIGARAVVIAYQDTPLMISETGVDVGQAAIPAGDALELAGPNGATLLAAVRNGRTVVVASRPFCAAGHLRGLVAAGATRFRADFAVRRYTPDALREIWRLVRAGRRPPGAHEGNLARGLA